MFDVVVLWLEVRPDSQEIEETIFCSFEASVRDV